MAHLADHRVGLRLQVRELQSRRDREEFLALPRLINRGNPIWVEPLRYDQRRLIDPKHPFYDRGRAAEAAFFLVRGADGQPLGRVAAIVNHLHNTHARARDGFFGFFESVNDQAVADALLQTAADWLRARGMTAMLGPASPSHNYEYGLLVEGFTQPQRFLLAHNPPYYPGLLERSGLSKARDLYAFAIDLTSPALVDALARDGVRIEAFWQQRAPDVSVRSANLKRFGEEVRTAVDLLNRSLEDNWGYSPMTQGELNETAQMLRYLVDPELLLIAERNGEPVGVSLAIPDLNVLLRSLRLRAGLLGVAELLARFKLARPNVARVVAMGVARDRTSALLGTILMYRVYRRLVERGIREVDASWILEDNVQMILPLKRFGIEADRTYRIYQKEL